MYNSIIKLAQRIFVFCTFLFVICLESQAAAVIHVPADYPKIQQAIIAAQNGDTVLAASGTYVENINFTGKSITVTSESGAQLTFIDGDQSEVVVQFIY